MSEPQNEIRRRERAARDLEVMSLFPKLVHEAVPAEDPTSPLHSPLVMDALIPADSVEAGKLLDRRLRALVSDQPLEIIQSFEADFEEPDDEEKDMVKIRMRVEETVYYPAYATIPMDEYESLLELFPHLREDDLPLGLLLMAVRRTGGRLVVDERNGDVRGQEPIGPVTRLEQSNEPEQGRG